MTADYMPDFFWINPQDKEALDLIKRGTADAAYVGSNTADGSPARLWGLPVIESNSIPVANLQGISLEDAKRRSHFRTDGD